MVISQLTCGHRVATDRQYANLAQASERCPVHDADMLVTDTREDAWHTRCGSCRFGRSHGKAKVYAERAALQHTARYPTHHVSLRFYNEWSRSGLIVESPTAATQLALPGFGDRAGEEPPY